MGSPTEGDATAVGVLFTVLGIFALSVRIYSNRRYQKTIEIDDMLLIPAFVLSMFAGIAIIVGAQVHIVGGHSLPMITPEQNARVGKFEYAFWSGHAVTIGFIKLSILFFFRRLFRGRFNWTPFDIANWTLITLVTMWSIGFFFSNIFNCGIHPDATWTSAWWTQDVCVNTSLLQLICAISNWLIDLAMLIEPLVMIWSLHLTTRRKFQFCTAFMFSILAVVAALLRMVAWIGIFNHGTKTVTILGQTLSTGDIQAAAAYCLFWTYIEIGVGFLVACLLPATRAFEAISNAPIFVELHSLTSSFLTRIKRSHSSSELVKDPEAESDGSSSVHARPKRSDLRHYSNEMAMINALSSTMNQSGDHAHVGNVSTIIGGQDAGRPEIKSGSVVKKTETCMVREYV